MNYSDVPTRSKTTYSQLKDTQNFNCDQTCLCRFTGERSTKDKMYYDWFVLDKPVTFPDGKESFTPSISESFKKCVCSSRQSGCSENCQDVDKVENAYVSGKATENSDRQSPGWNRGPEIGSYKFPKSCGGAPFANHPNFGPWDFTEFGQ
jgi:hypothetical protein